MKAARSLGGVLLFGAACAGELRGDPEDYRVSRPGSAGCDAPPILARRCAGAFCHSADDAAAGLDLGSEGVGTRLVDALATGKGCEGHRIIDPAGASHSLLLDKVESSRPVCGDRMPLTGSISPEEIACVRSWVTALVGTGDAGAADGAGPDAAGDGGDPDAAP